MPAIDFPNSPTNGQEFTSGQNTWVYDGTKWSLKALVPVSNETMPVASIMWFAGSSTPSGWLACDGAAVSRTTYALLFATIGTTYGAGDGSATFNVPSVGSSTGAYYIRHTTATGTIGAWVTYTPTWTSDSGTPSIGNGSITGRYLQAGKTVSFNMKLTYGTTTTGGSGAWMFGLPVTAYNDNYQFPVSILNNGLAWYGAIANGNYKGSTSYFSIIHQNDTITTVWGGVSSTAPFSFGSGDTLTVSGSYEAA